MKIYKKERKKIMKLLTSFSDSPDSVAFKITTDGTLIFTHGVQIATNDFIIASSDYWFEGNGFENTGSIKELQRNMFIAAYVKDRVIFKNLDEDYEYISPEAPISKSFYFYFYAKLPGGVLIFEINGQNQSKVIGVQFFTNWYTEVALRTMIRELITNQTPDFGKTNIEDTEEEEYVKE